VNIQDLTSRIGNPAPALVLARANTHLPFAVSVVVVILLAYCLARLFWTLYPATPRAAWQPPPAPATVARSATTAADYSMIAAAHLFGEASTTAPDMSHDQLANAPETSLSLQLRGAVAAADAKFAHAIIADANGNEKVYFVNSSVPGGATVQQIQPDRVILARAGQLEVLKLPRDSELSGRSTARATPATFRPVQPPGGANMQELVAKKAEGFLDVVRPQPFMPNGQLKGYRIYPGPNRQQFAALGLRAGDLVTEINGIALNNPAQGMEVFRSLGDAAQVTITVERDGQPQVLSLNMAQVNAIGATQ